MQEFALVQSARVICWIMGEEFFPCGYTASEMNRGLCNW